MENTVEKPKKGFFYLVEKGGNALPNPTLLFGILALFVLFLSLIGSLLGWGGVNPATNEQVETVNLLSRQGLHRIILEMITNFTSFAPLGVVLVAMLGLGIAEVSGLIKTALNAMLLKTPAYMITAMVVFVAKLSNVASDIGYILIIPLAGVIFHSLGRNPIAGIAAAFAGVSGGFAANILITTNDALLAGISTEAARIIDPLYEVLPTANYYFMAFSMLFVVVSCTLVTTKWIEPRLGKYNGDVPQEPVVKPTDLERKGLKRAGWVFLFWFALIFAGLIPENGILRGFDGTVLGSPVFRGFIAILCVMAGTAGIVYGYTVGTFKKGDDVVKGMNESYKTLASYMVLVFFAAQFVAWFRWSNLGMIIAVNGADALTSANIGLIPLAIMFVFFTAFLNLFIGSASAKWALLAPIFVPIFMLLGYSPELAQMIYRMGDSPTNIITPLLPYFALIIVYCQKYDKKAGLGTIMASMIPYSLVLFLGWLVILVGWILLELPLGPGTPLFYHMIGG
ncbi:MAG: AbgT family transporter [Bacteroidales bacterium]|nr:AbgT family transporter [Bacteroidales bacterium]